jgi:hypothetical protein
MADIALSQALRRIKKLKGMLAEQLEYAAAAVTWQPGKEPAFQFNACLEKANVYRHELTKLEADVAYTNATQTFIFVPTKETYSIAFAIRTLAELKSQIAWLKGLNVRTQDTMNEENWEYDEEGKRVRVVKTFKCAFIEARRVELAAKLQNEFDELNDSVERVNHQTTLKSCV